MAESITSRWTSRVEVTGADDLERYRQAAKKSGGISVAYLAGAGETYNGPDGREHTLKPDQVAMRIDALKSRDMGPFHEHVEALRMLDAQRQALPEGGVPAVGPEPGAEAEAAQLAQARQAVAEAHAQAPR